MFDDSVTLRRRLAELRIAHRDLDTAIEALHAQPTPNELAIRRMKKRKLQLKDNIAQLESLLIPDLNA